LVPGRFGHFLDFFDESAWLEQKPMKNHWQPPPCQKALLPLGTLARGVKKKSLPGIKN
jgi:hypothetical protein